MEKTGNRGGSRPGAGRPMGRKDRTPRKTEKAEPRKQIAVAAAIVEKVREQVKAEGVFIRNWVEDAINRKLGYR